MSITRVVSTSVDTWVEQNQPGALHPTAKVLGVDNGGSSDEAFAYIWFKNPAPAGATIENAWLDIRGRIAPGGSAWPSIQVTIRGFTDDWQAGKTKYSNRPTTLTGTATLTATNSTNGFLWHIPVTSIVQTFTNSGVRCQFRIAIDNNTRRFFYSAEARDDWVPKLIVQWSDAPSEPTNLRPSGNRKVSIQWPTLRFDYGSPGEDSAMAAFQVQFKSTATPFNQTTGFTTPAFDTGEVASLVPEYNTTITTPGGVWGGLADLANTYWTVRVKNADGVWSTYADPVQFGRDNFDLATAIVNPAVSPNNFVNEWTPTMDWTATGQTKFRVQIALTDALTTIPYNSGIISSTSTEHKLPKDVLTVDGQSYRLILDTWDSVDREFTPGDPGYLRVTRDFTFNEGASVEITSLAATQDTPRPWMHLTWNRATQPDSFTIVRNGQPVATDLDPSDLFVSGTSYQYMDQTADPNKQHTWRVLAIVNGQSSPGAASVQATISMAEVWLADLETGICVPMCGDEVPEWTWAGLSAVYEPIQGNRAIVITQSLQGPRGTATFQTSAMYGKTALEWQQDTMELLRRPSSDKVFYYADTALRCTVRNLNLVPFWMLGASDRTVSFEFYSQEGVPGGWEREVVA